MEYIILKGNNYYFSRRVPNHLKHYDRREYVRFSLKTDSRKVALKRASIESIRLENYWGTFESTITTSQEQHKKIVERASYLGFSYISTAAIATEPFNAFKERLEFVGQNSLSPHIVEAVLGSANEPNIQLSELWDIYSKLRADIKLNKTELQYRKWCEIRQASMKHFIEVVGDKPVKSLTRDDILNVRQWWIAKMSTGNAKANTANKKLANIKAIVSDVNDNYKLGLDNDHLFQNICFSEDDTETRKPFTTEYIRDVLLKPENLNGMGDVYRSMLHILAETGIGITEQANLRPEDIHLYETIPYVQVEPYRKNKLKTKFRRRVIPLVGHALDAFRKYPQGFSTLIKNADSASGAIGKYLNDHNLLPTKKHSAYSLRHSFQDRLTNKGCPDRIQVDLMGHKFANRVTYGEGGSLKTKYKWMKKIQLKLD